MGKKGLLKRYSWAYGKKGGVRVLTEKKVTTESSEASWTKEVY